MLCDLQKGKFSVKRLTRVLIIAFFIGTAAAQQVATVIDGSGMLTDGRDGKRYKTATIGGKRWMAENLNYKPQSDQSWCHDNDDSKCAEYGRLYDWNTAKTACMTGWHLPSREEWNKLVAAAGGDKKAGKRLKAASGWKWKQSREDKISPDKSGNGTDSYGFSALPGGYRGSFGSSFGGAGDYGVWWTATESDSVNAYYRGMDYDKDGVSETNYYKRGGRSARCVQD
jgi:uncharacterized protein (TIGR02145 family)